jgi:hypothetical protein
VTPSVATSAQVSGEGESGERTCTWVCEEGEDKAAILRVREKRKPGGRQVFRYTHLDELLEA